LVWVWEAQSVILAEVVSARVTAAGAIRKPLCWRDCEKNAGNRFLAVAAL
jgi:hypothetical protein